MTLKVSFWSDLPTNSMWTAEDFMTRLEQFRWHRSSTGYIRISCQATLGCHHHTSALKKRTVLLLPFLHREQTPHYRTLQWRYLDEAFSTSRMYSMTLSQSGVPYPHQHCVMIEVYLEGLSSHTWARCTPKRDSLASQLCRTCLHALEPCTFPYTKNLRYRGPCTGQQLLLTDKGNEERTLCRVMATSLRYWNQWHYDTCNNTK